MGQKAPEFRLTGADLVDINLGDLSPNRVVLNIFPSIDTGVCATSVRKFNDIAASMTDTAVVCISADLPFALGRFCGAEGIDSVVVASTFRSSFPSDYGTLMVDGPLRGLNVRAVIVVGSDGVVLHSEVVPAIAQEPDYDAALAVLA